MGVEGGWGAPGLDSGIGQRKDPAPWLTPHPAPQAEGLDVDDVIGRLLEGEWRRGLGGEEGPRAPCGAHCLRLRALARAPLLTSRAVKGNRPGKTVALLEAEIRALCIACREAFLAEPMLLEIPAPVHILGDMCGRPRLGRAGRTAAHAPAAAMDSTTTF